MTLKLLEWEKKEIFINFTTFPIPLLLSLALTLCLSISNCCCSVSTFNMLIMPFFPQPPITIHTFVRSLLPKGIITTPKNKIFSFSATAKKKQEKFLATFSIFINKAKKSKSLWQHVCVLYYTHTQNLCVYHVEEISQ